MIHHRDPGADQERGMSVAARVASVADVISSAETCLGPWRGKSMLERGAVVAAVAKTLNIRKDEFALLLSTETLKRIEQATAEVALSVDIIDFYAKCALGLCAPDRVASPLRKSYVTDCGRGVLVHVQPSRFPYFSLAAFVALNLTIGNVVVLTHAETCPGCAVAFERLWLDAGAPVGAFANVVAGSRRALSSIGEVMDCRAASFGGGGPGILEVMTSKAGTRPSDLDGLFQGA